MRDLRFHLFKLRYRRYLPDFVIVGFPRCGTTALLRILARHEDLSVIDDSRHSEVPYEPNAFATPRGMHQYVEYLDPAKTKGEKTPVYVLHPHVMRRIARIVPKARVIVCVRHPIQFLHSFYAHRVEEHRQGIAWSIDPGRVPFPDLVLRGLTVAECSARFGCYTDFTDANVRPLFPADQVLFVVQERLEEDGPSELARICDFLGVRRSDALESRASRPPATEALRPYACIDYATQAYREALAALFELYRRPNEELFGQIGAIPEWQRIDAHYRALLGPR